MNQLGKLINRIPGSRLLILNLPGSAWKMHIDIARQASRCQQVFSKPCLVNLISKDTHLIFSIYTPHYFLCFQSLKSENQSSCDRLVASIDSQTAGFEAAVETENQMLSSRISAVRDFSESQSTKLNDRDSEVQRFVQDDLRKVIPTGK